MWLRIRTVGTRQSLEKGSAPFSLEVPEGISVSEIIGRLGLKSWEIGFVLINGEQAPQESILHDRDQLTLVAPLAGG